MEVNALSNG